jgi:hypothetical protein
MTEIKRTVLAIVFSVLFLTVWIGLFLLKTPLVGVWYISTSRVIPRVICKKKKRKIGKYVGVWYIPTRHVKLQL